MVVLHLNPEMFNWNEAIRNRRMSKCSLEQKENGNMYYILSTKCGFWQYLIIIDTEIKSWRWYSNLSFLGMLFLVERFAGERFFVKIDLNKSINWNFKNGELG